MCGLAGVMGYNLGLPEVQRFKDLFLLAQLRGDDGAGMMAVQKKDFIHPNNVRVKRTTWSSGHLITTSEFDDCVKGDTNLLIGHARQPTRGGSKIEHVHPHKADHIYLVHNGTMNFVNGNTIKSDESDSRAVCRAIADVGPQKFVENSTGAYCLVWLDLSNQTVNFLRNSERTLYMCEEKTTTLPESSTRNLFWASEMWMLHTVLSRYHAYVKERHRFFALPANEHWSFPLDMHYALAEPKITKIEKKVYSAVYSGYDDYSAWTGGDQDTTPPFVKATEKSTSVTTTSTPTSGAGFRYVPPENRGGEKGTVVKTVPVMQAGAVILRSKQDALLNSASADKIGGKSQTATIFPRADDKENFVCKDKTRVAELIGNAPCVWCSVRPVFRRDTDETIIPPRIYPVRFTDTRGEYVCSHCISDLDVQAMVGIAV